VTDTSDQLAYSPELRRAVSHQLLDRYYFAKNLLLPDDIFIASYPRSGNHLVRFTLLSFFHHLRYGTFATDFSGMRSIPNIHDRDLEFAWSRPRIIKTHFPWDPRYGNVIHLIRDPRDVVVSYYHYTCATDKTPPDLNNFVDLFLRGEIWPCDLRFHTNSYRSHAAITKYICITYESLVTQPRREVRKLLGYLGFEIEDQLLERLIEHTSFENMVRIHDPESAKRGNVFTERDRILRKGAIGSYKDTLDNNLLRRVEEAYKHYLKDYSYA
jgi:hypothetical protein